MVVVFGNKKGGVWKSLTCINVAVAAALRGFKVCVVDADTNNTSNHFFNRRNEKNVELEKNGLATLPYIKSEIKKPTDTINKDLQLLDELFDLVLVDTGGYENQAFKTAIQVADIVYLPFGPCMADMEQLAATIKVIAETENFIKSIVPDYTIDTRLLVTNSDHNSRDMVIEAREIVKDLMAWCSLSSAVITSVKAVKTLQSSGLTIMDEKHKKRAMYDVLLDEMLGNRKVQFERGAE